MSDLRDRIAAAIEAQHVSEYQGGVHPEDVMRLADAVIRDVLTPEFLADLVIAAVQKAADDE